MSDTRHNKIQRVVKVAETDERQCAETTGSAQRQLNEQLNRLAELRQYRLEYSERAGTSRNTNAAQLKDYQSFLDRLDQAVTSQQQIIQECERAFEAHRARWQGKRTRLESLQKVAQRISHDIDLATERQAQRRADDRQPLKPLFADTRNSDI